jgi:hypothetical protein
MTCGKDNNNREVDPLTFTPRDLILLRVIVGVFIKNHLEDSTNPELQTMYADVKRLHQKINTIIRVI